jgi:hypothetical protein
MRLPRTHVPVVPPTVDEVAFRDLYRKSVYPVETSDGWTLVVTRYEPTPQPFQQPLLAEPLLLVHGFSQNRHTWTRESSRTSCSSAWTSTWSSSGARQEQPAAPARAPELTGRRPRTSTTGGPDSYLLHDLPATVAVVKEKTGGGASSLRHSMGGCSAMGTPGSTMT